MERYTNLAFTSRTVPHVSFVDGCEDEPGRTIAEDAKLRNEQSYAIHMFMLQLCINHTVLLETLCDKNDVVTGTALSASSPDEVMF
jgi:hypothetical protein